MEQLFMRVFERRDWVAAQMRQQVVSYSQSLACTLLASGYIPPPWLLPRPAAAPPAQGNTLKKPYLDVAAQKNADGVHQSLPETHKRAEKGTLEFDSLKPGRLHTPNGSETINHCQKRVSETVLFEFTATPTRSLHGDPSCTHSHELSHSAAHLLLQKDRLHPVKANLHEVPCSVTGSLAAQETTNAPATDSFEGPTSMDSPLLKNDSLQRGKLNYLKGPDSMANSPLEKDAKRTDDTGSIEEPHSTACYPLEKHTLYSDEVNFLEGPHSLGSLLHEKEPAVAHMSEPYSPEESLSIASPLLEKVRLGRVQTKFLEGSHSVNSLLFGKETGHTSETICSEKPYCMVSPKLDKNSISVCATNAPAPAHHKPSQTPSSLAKPSFESDKTGIVVDVHLVSANQLTSNESLRKEPVLYSVNRYSEQSSHALAKFSILSEEYDVSAVNNMDESLRPEVSGALYKNEQVLHTAERGSTILADKCLRRPQHEGTEHKIFYFDVSTETGTDAPQAFSDKILSSQPFSQHLLNSSRPSSSGEMETSFKPDVESTDGHIDRSTASRIQAQENSSSEKVVASCQPDYSLYTSSSTSTPSLDCQDDIHDELKTRADLLLRPQPSVLYFLDSSGSHGRISFDSEGKSDGSNWKSPVASEVYTTVSSSPERSMARPSDVISCNSVRVMASSCNGINPEEIIPQCSHSHLGKKPDAVTNSSPTSSGMLSDGDGCCITKLQTNSCFGHPDAVLKTVTVENQVLAQMDYVASGTEISKLEYYPSTTSPTTLLGYDLDQHTQQACALNKSIQEKSGHDSNLEFDKSCGIDYDPEGQAVSDSAAAWKNGNNCADRDETGQQRQSFSIPVPSSSPTIKERASEAIRNSSKLLNMSTSLCAKYKMNSKLETLTSDVYKPLLARFEKLIHQSSLDVVDTKWHNQSYGPNKLSVSDKYNFKLHGFFLMPNVLTYNSSNADSIKGDGEIPLIPSVQKYSMEKLPGIFGSTSECMGSLLESECFQIDELISIAEENENQENLPGSFVMNHSSQCLTGREKSASLSTRYVDVGRLDLKATKTCNTEPGRHLHLRTNQAIKNTKENRVSMTKKEGKVPQILNDRANSRGILCSKNERHKSEANLEKGWKPSNVVTNMTSFIPLVKQKQQPTNVKRDVRVKALEAAEATKCRAEKKQNECEMRKVAAELERIRLKQEREEKQKLVEQKRMDANIVTRKRHLEDDKKKEKARKKKCIEEAGKQQKQQLERENVGNGMEDASRKFFGDKELGKDLVQGAEKGLIPDKRAESVQRLVASESNNLMALAADCSSRSESSGLQVRESMSDSVDKSYEMSPYKDSDEEDDSDMEHKDEVRRRRKSIPSWVRKEFLDKIFLSNRTLDPRKIFERKCSFNLSDVFPVYIPQRKFD